MSDQNQGAGGERHDRNQIVDLEFLQGLISAVDGSGIDSLEISRGGTRIRIAKSPPGSGQAAAGQASGHFSAAAPRETAPPPPAAVGAPAAAAAPAPAPVAESSRLTEIKSPMVGTFYRSPSPDAPSYVEIGSRVVRGQTLCILEAMKLMNELQAEIGGVIREVCVENSEPVEYGQVLFRIEADA